MQTKYTLLTVCWAFLSLTLCAQTGSVSGTIVDAGDEVGLPGASVYLQGQPSLGTVTELDGSYTLLNVLWVSRWWLFLLLVLLPKKSR